MVHRKALRAMDDGWPEVGRRETDQLDGEWPPTVGLPRQLRNPRGDSSWKGISFNQSNFEHDLGVTIFTSIVGHEPWFIRAQ